jgi:hypothetical protein
MTSSDSLLLLLRRLDQIERKLDCMLEELQTPHCHRLFGTPGQSSKEGLKATGLGLWPNDQNKQLGSLV